MRGFDYIASAASLLTPRTTSLLTAIHEEKGRRNTQSVRPDILATLTTVARVQSIDTSNRIEGISTSDRRLDAIVADKVTPRNRAEEEIAGYRDVLAVIHESHDYIPPTPNVILQFHRDLFRHTPLAFAGRFKDTDNIIVERDATGESRVRFAPLSALATPELVSRICDAYAEALRDAHTDSLLVTAMFTLDFTCIHPFNDGNGRMSRLLTLLLLYRNGYDVGKYISVEHLIEKSKDTYYEALAASTTGWNDGTNDYAPFANYLLGVILAAYKEFDTRISIASGPGHTSDGSRPTKAQRIARLIDNTLAPLSKADIIAKLPDISVTTVERTLKALQDDGVIMKIGSGRATRYARRR
ncbi:Fic family protein [Bifidobacterium leontopitheci]|uniref:Cell division protein Fic n=1 Tax=Bifidobacterium leontopitheci TaxID=2650774 RepID=A0A6I1GQ27_9BIFI|nr:Fic family protein [Bifidobacterium leontopitheci]KAB7791387.1 cell division protein Fic [Bifidobacterium leontopitheci]